MINRVKIRASFEDGNKAKQYYRDVTLDSGEALIHTHTSTGEAILDLFIHPSNIRICIDSMEMAGAVRVDASDYLDFLIQESLDLSKHVKPLLTVQAFGLVLQLLDRPEFSTDRSTRLRRGLVMARWIEHIRNISEQESLRQ